MLKYAMNRSMFLLMFSDMIDLDGKYQKIGF